MVPYTGCEFKFIFRSWKEEVAHVHCSCVEFGISNFLRRHRP